MREAAFYNALNIAVGSDHAALRRLQASYGGWEACWRALRVPGVSPEEAFDVLSDSGIGLVLRGESGYPPLLSHIPHAPFGIYFRGDIAKALEPAVAVVGTRKATGPGKAAARNFGAVLARSGCVVVSGLAFGIDAAAHEGALEVQGRTVAVLANGLERIYPASHGDLADRIIEGGGAILSEYPPGTPPLAYRFLERNRLISGLAAAVLLIEAPEHSGVNTTARFAAEQDRDLFVVPGPIAHPNYKGSHRHIRRGAALVSDPGELLEDLGFRAPPFRTPAAPADSEEAKILAALGEAGRPLTIDEIIEVATLTSSNVNRALTMLALRNEVREEGGRYTLK